MTVERLSVWNTTGPKRPFLAVRAEAYDALEADRDHLRDDLATAEREAEFLRGEPGRRDVSQVRSASRDGRNDMSRDAYPLYEKRPRARVQISGLGQLDRARDLCATATVLVLIGGARVSYAYGLWALVHIGHRAVVSWSWRPARDPGAASSPATASSSASSAAQHLNEGAIHA